MTIVAERPKSAKKQEVLGVVRQFDAQRIKPDPNNPRHTFEEIPDLSESIKAIGQTTPGKVTLLVGDPDYDAMLVDGERRLQACLLAEADFLAYVVKPLTPLERLVQAVGANFNQKPHNCLENAIAIMNIMRLAANEGRIMTQAEVAKIFGGKSSSWVAQHLTLLKLSPAVQSMLIPKREETEEAQAETLSQEPTEEEAKSSQKEPRRRHIPFAIGLLLANFSEDKQLEYAKKILDDNMSVIKARRFIFQQLGDKKRARHQSPADASEAFGNKIMTMQDLLGIYVDLTFDELVKLFAQSHTRELDQYVSILDDLEGTVSGLKSSLQNILKRKQPQAT